MRKVFRMTKHNRRFRQIHLRAWRDFRGLSQETLAARVNSTAATISRLENGRQPYTQPLLEALAEALDCNPADIIMRPPGASTSLDRAIEGLSDAQRRQAEAIIRALKQADSAA